MDPSNPCIIIIGGQQVGKKRLLSLICSSGPQDSALNAAPWFINNKYYTAHVAVETRLPEVKELPGTCEGLVLVLDATQQLSFQRLMDWYAAVDTSAPEIRLLVANKADKLLESNAPLDRPAWLTEAMQWSANNGFEYVEACATNPAIDAQLARDGDVQVGVWGKRPSILLFFLLAIVAAPSHATALVSPKVHPDTFG